MIYVKYSNMVKLNLLMLNNMVKQAPKAVTPATRVEEGVVHQKWEEADAREHQRV
jgi:hypothetical protein